ncbi:MAG: Arc family DNA-binding protein [Kiritimatiellae bacterium]|nr:Arc family DNA-binding protein [Kiritimatiellia bacterium]
MKTMTIRNIPDDVAAGLAERARESGRSMNATAVAALSDSFGKSAHKPRKYADFSQFVGTMTDEEYERITKIIEESHEQIVEDEYKPWLYAAEDSK